MRKQKGYSDPPWTFTGRSGTDRALYQLHLVKLDEARKYIPRELSIVSLFGYTLGGFYLARYDDSPVGAFDECVALAGIVWNRRTSCAWAARVFVDDREARDHGRQHVGLPSRMCSFSEVDCRDDEGQASWWDKPLKARAREEREAAKEAKATAREEPVGDQVPRQAVVLQNTESRPRWRPWARHRACEGLKEPVCYFSGFPSAVGRRGPGVKLNLPSFSGRTEECPAMLRYTCQLRTRVRLVPPLTVSRGNRQRSADGPEALGGILDGRPVLALAFDDMEMTVAKPISIVGRSTLQDDEWEISDAKSVPHLVGA